MRMLLTCALVAAALPMVAQVPTTTASGQGTAKVTIQAAAATLTHTDGRFLNFGTITASSLEQKITIGVDTKTTADAFSFTKDFNEIANIVVDPTCNVLGGATADTILLPSISGNTASSTSGAIAVGGTLTVPAWALKGSYTGHYNVTLSYPLL